jgi:spore maturation protein CgeB
MLHIDNAEVRSMFEPGREIDVFANVDEMIDKIAYYLARPVLRREMIDRAYARCVPAYGYDARAELISRKILSLLETRRRPRQG